MGPRDPAITHPRVSGEPRPALNPGQNVAIGLPRRLNVLRGVGADQRARRSRCGTDQRVRPPVAYRRRTGTSSSTAPSGPARQPPMRTTRSCRGARPAPPPAGRHWCGIPAPTPPVTRFEAPRAGYSPLDRRAHWLVNQVIDGSASPPTSACCRKGLPLRLSCQRAYLRAPLPSRP